MPTNSNAPELEANEPLDYYEVLQVSPKADPEIIEAAYRRLALKYHPDHNPTPEATAKMQNINAAYATLKDPQRRAEYDQSLLATPYDDLTDDDYEPPVHRQWHWQEDAPGRSLWISRGSWLVVILLLLGVIGLAFLQNINAGQAATQTDNTATIAQTTRPVAPAPVGTLFYDDFESSGTANWVLDVPWHLTTRYSASGRNGLWFGEESQGRYKSNLNTSATLLRPVELGTLPTPVLRFKLVGQSDHELSPSGEDRLYVEVAEPGRDFQTLFTANGLYASWQEIALDLSRWRNKAVQVRFRFVSGSLNSGAGFSGFFIDDVSLGR